MIVSSTNSNMLCRNMNMHASLSAKSMRRISSGLRINSAADDAAGLGISEGMKAQIRGLAQASKNAQDGISLIQVMDGGLNETSSILQRMRELTVKASSGTYTDEDRKYMQVEFNQLTSEINEIGNDTEYNTMKILTGNSKKDNMANVKIMLQIGANSDEESGINLSDMTAKGLHIAGNAGGNIISKDGKTIAKFSDEYIENGDESSNDKECALDISKRENAENAMGIVDDAVNSVSRFRGILGANQDALHFRIEYLDGARSNLLEAQSRIEDADIAKEVIEYTKHNFLGQIGQAILSQVKGNESHIVDLLKLM